MASATARRESAASAHPSRSSNMDKMLELERKCKMERLHQTPLMNPLSQNPPSPYEQSHLQPLQQRTSTMPPPPRAPLLARRRDSSVPCDLLATASNSQTNEVVGLSITVPPPPNRNTPQIERKTEPRPQAKVEPVPTVEAPLTPLKSSSKTVTFMPGEKDEGKDDASSICQSPSWEGYGQRKKEKKDEAKQRRKDEKQAEKDNKEAKRKSTTRLTKAPPTPSHPPITERSYSSPALTTQNHTRRSSSQEPTPPLSARPKHGRSRSSSVTSQLRLALTGNWGKEKESGFVGGLKLDQEREAADRPADGHSTQAVQKSSRSSSRDTRFNLSLPKAHSFGTGSRASSQTRPGLPRQMSADGQSNVHPLLRRKGASPISIRSSSRSEILISPTAPPMPGLKTLEQWRTRPKPKAPEQEPMTPEEALKASAQELVKAKEEEAGLALGSPDTEEPRRGRQFANYVRRSRWQSSERAGSVVVEEGRTAARSHYPPQANRQHHSRAYSLAKDRVSTTQGSSTPRTNRSGEPRSPGDSTPEVNRLGDRSTSTDRLPFTPSLGPNGFKSAMQAALAKVRPTSRPPTAAYFDRPRRDASTPDSRATSRTSNRDRLSHMPKAARVLGEYNEETMRGHDSARPSSASSSFYADSIHSPSSVTTPNSSRPQSHKGFPVMVGEVSQGATGHFLVTNDERACQQSQRGTMTSASSPMTPRSVLPGLTQIVQKDNAGETDLEQFVRESWDKTLKHAENDVESFTTCLTPQEADESKSSLVCPPMSGSHDQVEPKEESTRLETAPNTLARAPSLSKSQSSPNVAKCGLGPDSAPVPPPRSNARTSPTVGHTSSVSLPDALTMTFGPYRTTDPAVPRPLRSPRMPGSPLAKMLVECCQCRFFHDMPSRVYECMARPDATAEDSALGVSGSITTSVNCPWCKHGMTTGCCRGYAAEVYLKQRLH
ncbi:conserved hypothetical protein [Verticillium alfalfae VaMs.102]|uniref:Uncharacterized protein n=1 Tax=Verticillium alfalfae (strain VaMs.102 / ATCC MYA-4576 / FGSC 10136) TaxID=526221 RepID=C9SHE0_VERA1|nr:conserved hypothetical protein [Verticillium alfalfae VaMs.102]EEY17734.1 conserved hypothetical protein [Verticillium alfalfae VaMs.102]